MCSPKCTETSPAVNTAIPTLQIRSSVTEDLEKKYKKSPGLEDLRIQRACTLLSNSPTSRVGLSSMRKLKRMLPYSTRKSGGSFLIIFSSSPIRHARSESLNLGIHRSSRRSHMNVSHAGFLSSLYCATSSLRT